MLVLAVSEWTKLVSGIEAQFSSGVGSALGFVGLVLGVTVGILAVGELINRAIYKR